MITDDTSLPTVFARKVAESSGILLKMEAGVNHHEYNERIDMMKAFQQMAITVSFEEAQVAFFGFNLTSDQIIDLRIIYNSTNSWIRGHAIGALMKDLAENKIFKDKDRVTAALAILEETATESDKNKDGKPKRKKGMLLKMANI